jgi:hypothetical protein
MRYSERRGLSGMKNPLRLLLFALILAPHTALAAADYYVAPGGHSQPKCSSNDKKDILALQSMVGVEAAKIDAKKSSPGMTGLFARPDSLMRIMDLYGRCSQYITEVTGKNVPREKIRRAQREAEQRGK